MISFVLPGHIRSKTNARGHWSGRAKIAKNQRAHGKYSTLTAFRAGKHPDPKKWLASRTGWVGIHLVRVAPRPLDDDNLRDALKSIRDGIADAFGVADNDPRLVFDYGQEKRPHPRTSFVRIEISWLN